MAEPPRSGPLDARAFIRRKQREWETERERQRVAWFKDIGRQGKRGWTREAWTFMPQHNYAEKVFVIERFRYGGHQGQMAIEGGPQPDAIEYRFGYFIVGKNGRAAQRWVWGQYTPMIPSADLVPLLMRAVAERTVLLDGDAVRHLAELAATAHDGTA